MKRNAIMEKARELITPEIKEDVDFAIAIVDRIFELLERNGITQRELAKRLGKQETEISRWMQGTHNFTISTIRKIEKALGEPILVIANSNTSVKYITISIENTLPVDKSINTYQPQINFSIPFTSSNLSTPYQC